MQLFAEKMGPNYFERTVAGVRIIGLNSCLLGSGLTEEQKQWGFLEKALAKPHSEPTLVLEHHPPFLESADEPMNANWNVRPGPRQRLLALFKQGGVKAVLSGHIHHPLTNQWEGILFLTSTATAFGMPYVAEPGWMLLNVSPEGEVRSESRKLD